MKVQDVMTKNPITISPDDTVVDALGIIDKFHVWSIPVVHKEKMVGIVTKQDIDSKSKGHEQKISDIMSKTPVTISPDEELVVAADIIKRARINAIIVAEGTKIVGIVTRYDVYKKSLLNKTGICHYCYPRGDSEKKGIFQCKYCKDWFCEEHTEPRNPMLAPFKSTDIEEHLEWEKIGGHPCIPYLEDTIDKERKLEENLEQMVHQSYGRHLKPTIEPTPSITPKPPTETILPSVTPEPREDGVRECSYCFQKSNELTRCKHCKEFFCKDHIEPKTAHDFLRDDSGHSCTPYAKQLEKVKEKEEPQPEPKKADEAPLYKHPNKFIRWFFWKKHPNSGLRKEAFAIHLTAIICLSFLFWIIYTNSDALNGAIIWIFKISAIVELVLLILIIRSIYKILVNLKYGIRGLANGFKLVTAIVFVLICFQLFLHPGTVVDSITGFRYDSLNPFEINWNYSNSGSTYDNGDSGNNQITIPTISNPKPVINIQELELEIHNLINNERQNNGVHLLQYDDKLADIARAHSQDMANRNYFSHYNPEGQGPTERAKAAGYPCYKSYGSYYTDGIAENIFQNNLYDTVTYYNGIPVYDWNSQSEIANSTVNGWMNSPGHRQNILTSTYDKEGIGVAIASDDKVYITEDFW